MAITLVNVQPLNSPNGTAVASWTRNRNRKQLCQIQHLLVRPQQPERSTASLVIPYSGAAGDLFVLGTLDSGAGIVGNSSIVDNGGNVWTVSYISDSQPGYDFNFNFVTATNPFTSITVTLTGSVSKIFAALGEYSNYSPSVTNVVRDFHQPAITEQNDSVAGNALISFYVAYGGGAFSESAHSQAVSHSLTI